MDEQVIRKITHARYGHFYESSFVPFNLNRVDSISVYWKKNMTDENDAPMPDSHDPDENDNSTYPVCGHSLMEGRLDLSTPRARRNFRWQKFIWKGALVKATQVIFDSTIITPTRSLWAESGSVLVYLSRGNYDYQIVDGAMFNNEAISVDHLCHEQETNANKDGVSDDDLGRVESIIGYMFKNKDHLRKALTHCSLNGNDGTNDNKGLAFLGDAILYYVATELFFDDRSKATTEELHNHREQFKKNDWLGNIQIASSISRYLLVGKSRTGEEHTPEMKATMMEAIIGAINLENKEAARQFVMYLIFKGQEEN